MVLHTDSHHRDNISHHIASGLYIKKQKPERETAVPSTARYEYMSDDIMLGTKEELGRNAIGEMCVHLQPAAKLCCSTLLA